MVPGSFGCGLAVLAATAMLAPSRAARSAIARPMPRLAPLMNSVFPARLTPPPSAVARRRSECSAPAPSTARTCALELDAIALRILHVEGASLPACTVARGRIVRCNALIGEPADQRLLIEGCKREAEVLEIVAAAGRATASERAVARLGEAELWLLALHGTAEHLAVESAHARRIADLEHDMVDALNGEGLPG